jgi:hypothetical protein
MGMLQSCACVRACEYVCVHVVYETSMCNMFMHVWV